MTDNDNTPAEPVRDIPVSDIVEVYRDKTNKWRWRRIDGYNKTDIVSDSGQGYRNKEFCEDMAAKVNGGDFTVETKDA